MSSLAIFLSLCTLPTTTTLCVATSGYILVLPVFLSYNVVVVVRAVLSHFRS
jgi:hypothetical protein